MSFANLRRKPNRVYAEIAFLEVEDQPPASLNGSLSLSRMNARSSSGCDE
jgi:hypothetical protein